MEKIISHLDELKGTLEQLDCKLVLDSNNSALISLKHDLEELIGLKQAELLSIRKTEILQRIQVELDSNRTDFDPDGTEEFGNNKYSKTKLYLSGQKCSVPGWTISGKFISQNAIICSSEDDDNDDGLIVSNAGPSLVRILLANPTHWIDVPCDKYFELGSCERGARCSYSHGKLVNVVELGEWYEPDPEKYHIEGQSCLAKLPSGENLWRHAYLLHTDPICATCVIEWACNGIRYLKNWGRKTKSYSHIEDNVISLPLDCVHILQANKNDDEEDNDDDNNYPPPIELKNKSSSSSDFESDDEKEDQIPYTYVEEQSEYSNTSHHAKSIYKYFKVKFKHGSTMYMDDLIKAPIDYLTMENKSVDSSLTLPLGHWEIYTRGIGSRILSHMGYSGRGGLGRFGQGLEQPVATSLEKYQVRTMKWNKRPSLDLVMMGEGVRFGKSKLRKNLNLSIGKDLIPSSNSFSRDYKIPKVLLPTTTDSNFFNFLNSALKSSDHHDNNLTSELWSKSTSSKNVLLVNDMSSTSSNRPSLLEVQQQIRCLNCKIKQAQEAVLRNESRDRLACQQAQEKMTNLRHQLDHLKQIQRKIEIIHQEKLKEKRLRVF